MATMTLVGKGGCGLELKFARAKELELTREIFVRQQFQCLQNTAEAVGGNDMDDGPVMTGDRDELAGFSGADGSRGFTLELLHAVCILHENKLYFRVVLSMG